MCDGCKDLNNPCGECKEFLEWAHAQRSRLDLLEEEVRLLRGDVDDLKAKWARREESDRVRMEVREWGV